MASYGAQVRRITTAEINRILREGKYTRWAYFVDENVDKVGVIFANDSEFGAYDIDDSPDPKLHEFGHEKISDLTGVSDRQLLILTAGDNEFAALVFNDPMLVDEDDFSDSFNYDTLHDWQQFLVMHGLQRPIVTHDSSARKKKLIMAAVIVLILIFTGIAIFGMRTAP